MPFRPDIPECGLYPTRSPDYTKWMAVSFCPDRATGKMKAVVLPEEVTNVKSIWPSVIKKVLSADEAKQVVATGHLPVGFGAAAYLHITGRLPYAPYQARLRPQNIPLQPGEPDFANYI